MDFSTDHISLFQRRDPHVIQQLQLKSPEELAVTIVSYEEQLRGWLKFVHRASNHQQMILGYAKLNEALGFFCSKQVLEFSPEAVAQYADLISQKMRVGTQDLRIASIVLSIGGVLVTRNRRDFERVPGLQIEDWSFYE